MYTSRWIYSAFVLLGTGVLAAPATAYLVVEDFEATSTGGFTSPPFVHNILDLSFFGPGTWEFDRADQVSVKHSLLLDFAVDIITFEVLGDEYVGHLSVWMYSSFADMPALVEIQGLDEQGAPLQLSAETPYEETWFQVDSSDLDFSVITSLRLSSEGIGKFDDIALDVAPEPATLGLLTIGLLGTLCSRRSRPVR